MKAILQGQKVSGLPSGGTTGQVLTKTETGSSWQDTIKELPENGTTGQILEKTATGTQWTDKPASGMTKNEADGTYLMKYGEELYDQFTLRAPMIDIYSSSQIGIASRDLRIGQSTENDSINNVTMCTTLNMNNNKITNLDDPVGLLDAANKYYVDSKDPKSYIVTLSSNSWSASGAIYQQTVTVTGVLADETKQLIMPMPAMASQNAYAAAGIACTAQAANALTFTAKTVPTEAITVFVTVQGVS